MTSNNRFQRDVLAYGESAPEPGRSAKQKDMRLRILAILALVLSPVVIVAQAAINDSKELAVDFTDRKDAAAKAVWSESDKITVSEDGLGWDGEVATPRHGWIQTKPLALGLSWRPPYAISVRVVVHPLPTELVLNSGQKSNPYGGDVYVRYSADRKHWSSWQALQPAERQSRAEKTNPGRHFQGMVRVPYREREEYGALLSEYSRLDVLWTSDEEAAARWITEKDPDFFAKHIPLIGYVEFLFEGRFYSSQRIRSFRASISYGMGGLHSAPKDKSAYKDRDVPWRFETRQEGEQGAAADADKPRR